MKNIFIIVAATIILAPLSIHSAIVGDIDSDGQINLTEAIYALQVAAGQYPNADPSCQLAGKGDWNSSTANYFECDVVKESGFYYICTSDHLPSSSFASDSANWTQLVLQAAWNKNVSDIFFNNGNVGIGTLNPSRPLHINGNGAHTVALFEDSQPEILLNNSGSNSTLLSSIGFASGGTRQWSILVDPGGLNQRKLSFYDNVQRKIRFLIDPYGNVGIGTEYPNEPLEVAGVGRVFIGDGGGENRTGLLIDANNEGNYVRILPFDYGLWENMDLWFPSDVGIGTSTPTAELEVRGEIRTTDEAGNNRLWGKGRPNVTVYGWSTVNSKGYQQGMSKMMTTWNDSDDGCPSASWVCSESDIDLITDMETGHTYYETCGGGDLVNYTPYSMLWLNDAYTFREGKEYVINNDDETKNTVINLTACYLVAPLCCRMPPED